MYSRVASLLRILLSAFVMTAFAACFSSQDSYGEGSAWSDVDSSGGYLSTPNDSWGDEEDSSQRRVFGSGEDSWEDEPSVSNKRILSTGKDSWDDDDEW